MKDHVTSSYHVPGNNTMARGILQGVSPWPLTAEGRGRLQASPSGICGGQSYTGTNINPSTSDFSCQSHYTIAPHIHSFFYQHISFVIYHRMSPNLNQSPIRHSTTHVLRKTKLLRLSTACVEVGYKVALDTPEPVSRQQLNVPRNFTPCLQTESKRAHTHTHTRARARAHTHTHTHQTKI